MRCIRKGGNLSNHTNPRFSSYTNAFFSYFAPFTAIWGDGGKPNGGPIFFAKKLLHDVGGGGEEGKTYNLCPLRPADCQSYLLKLLTADNPLQHNCCLEKTPFELTN